jgi:arylsulfatase A-like enzyme
MKDHDRPNFLFIITDQQRRDSLGCYGNQHVRTPCLDGLARDGVCFDNHFVTNVVCSPSRASLLTGRYPNRHGLNSNGCMLPLSEITVAETFRQNGYRTAAAGKVHLSPHEAKLEKQSPESRAWWEAGRRLPLPYYGFEEVQLAVAHGPGDYADYYLDLMKIDPALPALIYEENALARSGAPASWKSAIPEQYHSSTWVADKSIDYINRFAAEDDPFFLFASFPDPHFPYCPPAPWCDMYDAGAVPMPNRSRQEVDTASEELQRRWKQFEEWIGCHALDMPDAHIREIIAHTYGMVSLIDKNVGRILDGLKTAGLEDDTVVVFMSDHGEHLGDHHLIYKCVVFDELIRVPSVWRFPGRFPADHRVSGFSSMIDVMPTLLNLAGIPAPPGLQGESLTDALAGKDWAGRRFVLIENDDVVASPALAEQAFSRTLRTEKYSINVYSTHSDGELYDLEADPGQLRNVWSDPAYSSAKSDLLVQLVRYSAAATFDATNVALGEV